MIVAVCTLDLYLPGNTSLKGKRGLLRPLLAQLRRHFEIGAAEVEDQDHWQSAQIALAVISNEESHAYTVLEQAVHWIENEYRAVEIVNWRVELR
jgi:uncharacterized protein YlxP (DUF503 family)